MMWKPYSVFTNSGRSSPWEGVNAACWNAGTVWPSTIQPRSPPFGFRGVVLGVFLCEVLEIGAGFSFLQDVFGLLPDFGDFGVGLADGLEQNVFDVDAVFDFVFVDVVVVIGLKIRVC